MRYGLEKKIRLQAGTHRILLGVPEENYTKTMTVTLQQGKSYTLEYRPIYIGSKWDRPVFRQGFLGFSTLIKDTSTN